MARNDIRQLNRIIFGHGNIQISPAHVQMLNNKDPVPYIPMGKHQPPSTGYQVLLGGYASHILAAEKKAVWSNEKIDHPLCARHSTMGFVS